MCVPLIAMQNSFFSTGAPVGFGSHPLPRLLLFASCLLLLPAVLDIGFRSIAVSQPTEGAQDFDPALQTPEESGGR